jgi:hypothetical protein
MFGKKISERVKFCFNFFNNLPSTTSLVLGGAFSPEKLMFLQASYSFFQHIYLVGEIGFEVSSWATSYHPDTTRQNNSRDLVMRALFDQFRNNKEVILHLPQDVQVVLPPPPKDEPVVDPKKAKANPKEESQVEEPQGVYAVLKRQGGLSSEDHSLLVASLTRKSLRGFDIEKVETWEELQRQDLARIKREELIRQEQERIRREEEAAKDPKKKKDAGGKVGTVANMDKRTMAALQEQKIEPPKSEVPAFYHDQDESKYFASGMTPICMGEDSLGALLDALSASANILWLGSLGFNQKWSDHDKKMAKLLRTRRIQMTAEEETLNAEAREKHVGLKIGVIGGGLIELINTFDLKDPAPPKVKRVVDPGNEDGEEEEVEDEDEEGEEEEDELDEDDLSSAEVRRRRKKLNIDQITDLYNEDQPFFLKMMGGEYIEGRPF